MKNCCSNRDTFMVQVKSTQNASWQGVVTWMDGQKTQPFRSVLELIKLIDSAIESNKDNSS